MTTAESGRILALAGAGGRLESLCLTLASAGLSRGLVVVTSEDECRTAFDMYDPDVVIADVSGPSRPRALLALLTRSPHVGVVLAADSWDDLALEPCEGRVLVSLSGLGPSHLLDAVEQARNSAPSRDSRPEGLAHAGILAESLLHDFNNLLTAILGNAAYALSTLDEGHPARSAVSMIEAAGTRAVELAERFSTVGHDHSRKGAVDLERLLQEVSDLLQVRMKPGARIQLAAEADLPPLRGDPVELYRLVLNLGTNAARAVEQGGSVRMSVSRTCMESEFQTRFGKLPAGRYFKLVVEDTGCGMDQATQESMFDAFFTTKERGSGLGLAITERIVRAHRGGVLVRSQPGSGTTVEVYLPAQEA